MRQISRRMEMIHPTIGWRRDEHGTHKHAHGSWILWSVSRVCSKTMHSLPCITSWLPYITLCYIDSRFFLPLEQSRTALLGCRLAVSRLPEAARWQLLLLLLLLLLVVSRNVNDIRTVELPLVVKMSRKPRVKWSDRMTSDLLEFERRAKELTSFKIHCVMRMGKRKDTSWLWKNFGSRKEMVTSA